MPKLTEPQVLSRSRASSLDTVKKLNCWANKIDDISIVKDLKNVEVVNLSCNAIRTLEPFLHCEQLRELYVRRNCIRSLAEIQHLKGLDSLRNLWLADNPCTDSGHYRMTVIKTLPSLEKLDNMAISDEEREVALLQGLDLEAPSPDSVDRPIDLDDTDDTPHGQGDPVLLSLEETNQLRVNLGLKPVSADKHSEQTEWSLITKPSSSNTLQAVMLLLDLLNDDELEKVQNVVKEKLSALNDHHDHNDDSNDDNGDHDNGTVVSTNDVQGSGDDEKVDVIHIS